MAADDEQQNSENEGNSGGKSKLPLLIIVGLLLVGISVGGTIAALSFLKEEPAPAEEGEVAEEAAPPAKPAIYYPLKPEYILNIDARGRRRFLRLDITLLTRDDDVIAAVETHRASIDNTVNLIGGGQVFEEIQTAEGKEFLRLQLLQELQAVLEKEIGKPGIEQVLFTNFVMQ
jgi:flagellar FliL protein